ncbi:murein DD-endopeptidase MepM/ murein hydrolase activator NlpD [Mariniflexile fucanivorans]|uniref:Murein DD-endopeptidase MepM/ murein hydrolase activator NlpD n=1 Tax=Mariniflexile fucanivorans TaxID=264023 RepID=A0A4R1RR63_9FLAO|nr:peptidoglycan DD-metalloendopeptidase family protein [Mariniflexile fucanivorans]TCL68905.1 murein DD-endopeptidase MepM/ murein hydrolase activator NlpD [Mariniflexile fucanivorans]
MDKERDRRMGSKYLVVLLALLSFIACKEKEQPVVEEVVVEEPADIYEFGFNLSDFVVKKDTVRKGDSFGVILERNNIGYPRIFSIAEKARDTFDIRRLQIGKPYTLLCSKDTLEVPKHFIYQPNQEEFVVISFQDSIHAYTSRKPIKYVEKTVTGVLNSSISQALDKRGISPILTNMLAEQIYAWTIDFTRLQKGDTFKVIYTDKYIDDTIYAGIHNVKAVVFNHKNTPYYAFRYRTDSIKNIYEYYNEAAKDLRRAFLKAPVKFSRISSKYNLNRRIAYYGFALRPHKGTDFAAPIGTEIMATANGTVTESQYKGGNGNYVKIRHNSTYETQYLHMQRRKVKVGDHVKQGDVIGWIGMTGNTGGPHVCYRFWKNGKQVDPFKEKLSQSEPIAESLKGDYLNFIKPIKVKLDALPIFDDSKEKEVKTTIKQKE